MSGRAKWTCGPEPMTVVVWADALEALVDALEDGALKSETLGERFHPEVWREQIAKPALQGFRNLHPVPSGFPTKTEAE